VSSELFDRVQKRKLLKQLQRLALREFADKRLDQIVVIHAGSSRSEDDDKGLARVAPWCCTGRGGSRV
jgi:hypothetical protein